MTALQRIRADLLEHRLWPLAAGLLVALVAAPVLLLRHASSAPPAPSPATSAVAAPPQSMTLAGAEAVLGKQVFRRGRRLGSPRDPFRAPHVATVTAAGAGSAAGGSGGGGGSRSAGMPGGLSQSGASGAPLDANPGPVGSAPVDALGHPRSSGSPSSATPPGPSSPSAASNGSGSSATPVASTPSVAATPAKARTWTIWHADVQLSHAGAGAVDHDALRLAPYPSVQWPLALYMGVLDGGRHAAFLVSGGVAKSGPGRCRPRKRLCTYVLLSPGQTEFLDLAAAGGTTSRWRLTLVRLHATKTPSRADAKAAFARVSAPGRCVLDVLDLLRYDGASGMLAPSHDVTQCRYAAPKASSAALPGAR